MPDGPASWHAIQAEVLHRIRSREWPPGGLIPNEADLAERTTWMHEAPITWLRQFHAPGHRLTTGI